jgi:subtilase family serine protease
MQRRHRRSALRRALVLVGAAVPLATTGLMIGPAGASGARVTLAGSRPAAAARMQSIGPAAPGESVDVQVYLTPHGGVQALQAAVAAVSTPGSPQYRHFITPAQYRARYGPDSSSVDSVTAWLAGSGMKVAGLDSNHRFIQATGTVASAEKAFGVTLANYRNQGRVERHPTADISVPADVASAVLGVTGLSTPSVMKPQHNFPPPAGFRNAHPCSLSYGQYTAKFQADGVTPLPKFDNKYRKYAVCGYVPSQFRAGYGLDDTSLSCDGVTVAITDAYAASTIRFDANTYATTHGDPAFVGTQFSQVMPELPFAHADICGGNGWFGEETLDVEAVHGMAPDANILYYAGRSCYDTDLLTALQRVVDDNQASIVTNSWGEPIMFLSSSAIAAYEQVFTQGALQGIGFFFSSGDGGDELQNWGLVQTDYPTSDPNVTSVGGTSTGIDINNKLVKQTGWGTTQYNLSADEQSWEPRDPFFRYGAGGGFANLWNRPDYQEGVVPPGSPAGRAVPDVALDADPSTGMLVGETQEFSDGTYWDQYRIGGTSLASPLMAGMQALAEQNAGDRLGFANPAIYGLAISNPEDYTDVLHLADANVRPDYVNGENSDDGISYSVRTFDQDTSLLTVPGWDDVTGIGQPNSGYLTAFGP